jgi:hypothetical protein
VTGAGTETMPIRIHFAPGRYDVFPEKALRRRYHISNTNGDPYGDKAIGLLFEGAKHVVITGPDARLVFHGKMMEVCIDACESITINDLQFDYARPTVSEFRVSAAERDYADIEVHPDSTYSIHDGRITWTGEGWRYDTGLAQELDPDTNEIWRREDPLAGMTLEETGRNRLRARGKHDMTAGRIYQIRNTWRDMAGVFTRESRDIAWKNVSFFFLHGMGIVNQFSENLFFDTVSIAPDPQSGRTCAAWADAIQASGCRGHVEVTDCTFSGAHDDAINIHGTYLRVIEVVSERQIRVRFMHRQTYGFAAFQTGDEIEFTRWDSLETYGANRIAEATLESPEQMLLTLEDPISPGLRENDAVEDVTWTPEVSISGCTVSRIPTSGFLVATRGKAVIERNTFTRTHMGAILLGIDASDWFESGPVRDMIIRENAFVACAEPVIEIEPHHEIPYSAVHRNVTVIGNRFLLRDSCAVRAKSTTGLTVSGNDIYAETKPSEGELVRCSDCEDVIVTDNQFRSTSEW